MTREFLKLEYKNGHFTGQNSMSDLFSIWKVNIPTEVKESNMNAD